MPIGVAKKQSEAVVSGSSREMTVWRRLHAELSAEDALAIYRTIDQVAHASCAWRPWSKTLSHSRGDARTSDYGTSAGLTRSPSISARAEKRPSQKASSPAPRSGEVQVVVDAEVLAGV